MGGSRILYDNPDTVYRFMAVNKTSTYVIKGKFEDYDPADPTTRPADTTFSLLTGLSGNTADVLTKDELVVNDDGTFEIYVSAGPPPPSTTELHSAHVRLHPDRGARHVGGLERRTTVSLSIVRIRRAARTACSPNWVASPSR